MSGRSQPHGVTLTLTLTLPYRDVAREVFPPMDNGHYGSISHATRAPNVGLSRSLTTQSMWGQAVAGVSPSALRGGVNPLDKKGTWSR